MHFTKNSTESIVIDFSPIKSGGGVQLALNFIEKVDTDFCPDKKKIVLVPNLGALSKIKKNNDRVSFVMVPSGKLGRFFFEYFSFKELIKKYNCTHVYTFFGTGLPHPKSVKSLVGVAYPIICYPESIFWEKLPFKKKVFQKVLNHLRCVRLKESDHIIVETEVMKKRLVATLKLDDSHFTVLMPTVTDSVEENKLKQCFNSKFLVLSGAAPHKNIWQLYDVAQVLNERKEKCTFVISVSEDEYLEGLKRRDIDMTVLGKYFQFVGSLHPSTINRIYETCDVLINISDLESFSNNYMEAWKSGVPIIASDRDFSRGICKESALYVEPHKPNEIADAIIEISTNNELRENMTKRGKELLDELPTFEERIVIIQNILNKL